MGGSKGKFPTAFYNPQFLLNVIRSEKGEYPITEQDIRKEYSRLRQQAIKNLSRFKGTEWEDTQVYKYNANRYKTLSEIDSGGGARELASLLTDLHDYVNAKTATISGLERQRAQAIETLHDRGYTFVTKDNFKMFTQFMDDLRQKKIASLYDSERLAELFATAEKNGVSIASLEQRLLTYTKNHTKTDKQRQNLKRRDSAALWKGLSYRDSYNRGTPSKSSKRNSNSKKK